MDVQLAPFPVAHIICPPYNHVFASRIQYHRNHELRQPVILVCSPCIDEAGGRDPSWLQMLRQSSDSEWFLCQAENVSQNNT